MIKQQPTYTSRAWTRFLEIEGKLVKTIKLLEQDLKAGEPTEEIKAKAEVVLLNYSRIEIAFLQDAREISNKESNQEYQDCLRHLIDAHERFPKTMEKRLSAIYSESEAQQLLTRKLFDYLSTKRI
ncbi:MAG: hypothetical protein WCI72_06505 [archaeon]